jgi:hypothetical protein
MDVLTNLVKTMEYAWTSLMVTNVSVRKDLVELTAQSVNKI